MRWLMCTAAAIAAIFCFPAAAMSSSSPCETATPAELIPKLAEETSWTQAIGEGGQPERILEYKHAACELPAGQVLTGKIHGLTLPDDPQRVKLILKTNHDATLIIRFKEGDLRAGQHAGVAVVHEAGVSIAQPFKLTVTYREEWAGLKAFAIAAIIGIAILILQAAVASPQSGWRKLLGFSRYGISWFFVIGAGLGASFTTLQTAYFAADFFAGRAMDWIALAIQLTGAFVAAATTISIGTIAADKLAAKHAANKRAQKAAGPQNTAPTLGEVKPRS